MKKLNLLFIAGVVLVACTVVVGVIVSAHRPRPGQNAAVSGDVIQEEANPIPLSAPGEKVESAQHGPLESDLRNIENDVVNESSSSNEPSLAVQDSANPTPEFVQPLKPKRSKPKRELQDPMARKILALVGSNPDAEAYWIRAIFDTSLPDEERDDLMEDLNEEGLSDTKHPGPQDRELILKRLVIIEEVMPYADDFMKPHLQEAYKDLQNLLQITQGGGEPVK